MSTYNVSFPATLTITTSGGGGTGDVTGPVSSTDNAIVRWDGTAGDTIQNSTVTISDTGAVSGVRSIAMLYSNGVSAGTLTVEIVNGKKQLVLT